MTLTFASSLNGAFNAPIMGLFVLGCFFKVTNAKGAIVGAGVGFLSALWISLGSYIANPQYPKLDVSIELCNHTSFNQSILESFRPYYSSRATNLSGFNMFYSLSYTLFTAFGLLVTVVFGLVASLLTKGYHEHVDDSFILVDLLGWASCWAKKPTNKTDPVELNPFLKSK